MIMIKGGCLINVWDLRFHWTFQRYVCMNPIIYYNILLIYYNILFEFNNYKA